MRDNTDLTCYVVTKHSWKGKYKRIFAIGSRAISTYNPSSLELTNQWLYRDVVSVKPVFRSGCVPGEFVLNLRIGKKSDCLRFSSDYSPSLMSDLLRFRESFADPTADIKEVNAQKFGWSGLKTPCRLKVCESRLQQLDFSSGFVVTEYLYKDVVELIKVVDVANGFVVVCGAQRRMHMFSIDSAFDDFFQFMDQLSHANLGVRLCLRRDNIGSNHFYENRLGKLGSDMCLTSLVEFVVFKNTDRYREPVKRLMCISESYVLERHPQTYDVVTCRHLSQIHCLVRSRADPQAFIIEYVSGERKSYSSAHRDDALVSLLDGARAAGNDSAHVRSKLTPRGSRLLPFGATLDEETESQQARLLVANTPETKFEDTLERFNCNMPYSGLTYSVTQEGLFSENKEKLIVACLTSVIDGVTADLDACGWESLFQALRRLFASKAGFAAFTCIPGLREKLGNRIVAALRLEDPAVTYAALDCLCALMQPSHANYELRREQANKASLLSSTKFLEFLLDTVVGHITRNTGALVIANMLDFLTFALCDPFCETTPGEQFDALLELVAARGRSFYQLFNHSSSTIVKGAGLVMKALIEESDDITSRHLQELALTEGALLRHLHIALFTSSRDVRFLTNRQLSRKLVALWVTGNPEAYALLRRMLPSGLVNSLNSKEEAPSNEDELLLVRNNLEIVKVETIAKPNVLVDNLNQLHRVIDKRLDTFLQHWRQRENYNDLRNDTPAAQKPITLRRRRNRVKCNANWKLFFYHCATDHCKADLIWNHKTREEFKEALDSELRSLNADRELAGSVRTAWNYEEFEVVHPSLSSEIRIGDYYLRLLLDEGETSDATPMANPKLFFLEVYHRFLLTSDVELRCLCLKALTVVYARCSAEIGPFMDTKYILAMLEKCTDFAERDSLIRFLEKLILRKENVGEMVKSNSFRYLIDLACLAHLHQNRAYIPTQTNVIEASPNMIKEDAKEWYYSKKEKDRQGPFGFSELKRLYKEGAVDDGTRCWAQGADQWRPLRLVPQLRWSLFASGVRQIANDTDLAIIILNMLIKMCEYYPARNLDDCIVLPVAKIKSILTDPSVLPHIVQLLLTFDPIIVEKTAALLYLLAQDNAAVSRLYLTGAFYFVLMYTGSNLLPIAKFLHYAHMKQAFRVDKNSDASRITECSFLRSVLPEAAILYLEYYGPERYAEVFLSNYDTPEIIWNAEMRRYMIEKIASHVADFSSRLRSNVKVVYQFCPIAPIFYAPLESELFCHVYYLRHLCDTAKFPDWSIRDPVAFLKACLNAWAIEVSEKPVSMSVEEAMELLHLDPNCEWRDESLLRRAYFRMAQKYHPDKNPEGREMFEKVNRAYELLCMHNQKQKSMPDEERVLLCVRAQSVVYGRHGSELAPFKYAGYDQLIKTVRMETAREKLFPKAPLLEAAAELCHLTLVHSPLNAEQLRRQNGLEVLSEALNRCAAVVGACSAACDSAVRVCCHVLRCFSAACRFEACAEALAETKSVYSDLVRLLRCEHLRELCAVACECVCSLSGRTESQNDLFHNGVLWYLLPNLFLYDFTLEEGGVRKSPETSEQESINLVARLSCEACACLAGLRDPRPRNDQIVSALSTLLTNRICYLLQNRSVGEVLKTLNMNTESPYLIWDNRTRGELLEFVEKMQKAKSLDATAVNFEDFKCSAHEKELIIGNVYIRVYNEQPSYCLENPENFCANLLNFVDDEVQLVHSRMEADRISRNGTAAEDSSPDASRFKRLCAVLRALRNVLHSNQGLEELCVGHFRLLFGALCLERCPEAQCAALDVIQAAIGSRRCLADVAERGLLAWPLLCAHLLPRTIPAVCALLLALLADTRLVKELLDKGGGVYLLDALLSADRPAEERVAAAEVLAKAQGDKLNGPRWSRFLLRFLPHLFLDLVRDSPADCVRTLDGPTENPELVWNEEMRFQVAEKIRVIKMSIVTAQLVDPSFSWTPPNDFNCAYEQTATREVVVGGVFLRLYAANPSWTLRNPRQFAADLLEAFFSAERNVADAQTRFDLVVSSLITLLQSQPNLSEMVCSQGYLAQIVEKLQSNDDEMCRALLLIMQQIVRSEFCVECLSKIENFLPNLRRSVENRPDLLPSGVSVVRLVFEVGWNQPWLVRRTLDCGFLTFLLQLLASDRPLEPVVRAEIATAIQKLAENPQFSDQISTVLKNSPTWAEYKDQKHELFLPDARAPGRIAANTGLAVYLTQALPAHRPSHTVPPPP